LEYLDSISGDTMISVTETAKVFMSGRSQAVRLPKAFRFATDEVTIERKGDAVIMRPKLSPDQWWAEVTQALQGFAGMDFVERDRAPLVDDIVSFDNALTQQK